MIGRRGLARQSAQRSKSVDTEQRPRPPWPMQPAHLLPVLTAALALLLTVTAARAEVSFHKEISRYEGPATCLDCHEATAREVAETLHYQLKGTASGGGTAGMLASFCDYANTLAAPNWLGLTQPRDPARPAQPTGCGRCHAGFGALPAPVDKLTEKDIKNVDCFICHAPGYRRTVVPTKGTEGATSFGLAPEPGIDLLAMVRGVQKPSAEMCQRCHGAAGGGPNFFDGVVPTADSDVHSSMGMNCIECHSTKKHRISGGGNVRAQDGKGSKVQCENCHNGTPHKGDKGNVLNRHCVRIACQTCHIPAIARDPGQPTVLERDWTKPVLNPQSGLHEPTDRRASKVKAEYFWWNGSFTATGEPVGSRKDPQAKIWPWKRTTFRLVADAASGKPLPLKASVYAVQGDPGAAAKAGAEETRTTYSGQWKAIEASRLLVLNHQIAPKEEALKCENCHDPKGVMDIKALTGKRR